MSKKIIFGVVLALISLIWFFADNLYNTKTLISEDKNLNEKIKSISSSEFSAIPDTESNEAINTDDLKNYIKEKYKADTTLHIYKTEKNIKDDGSSGDYTLDMQNKLFGKFNELGFSSAEYAYHEIKGPTYVFEKNDKVVFLSIHTYPPSDCSGTSTDSCKTIRRVYTLYISEPF